MKWTNLLVVLALLTPAGLALEAQAVVVRNLGTGQTVFVDDFEGVTPIGGDDDPDNGALPGNWVITGAGGVEPDQTQIQVISDMAPGASEGNNYLRVHRRGSPRPDAIADLTGPQNSGVVRAELMVLQPSGQVDQTTNFFFEGDPDATAGNRVNRADIIVRSDGRVHYRLFNSGQLGDSGLVISLDAWHRFDIEYAIGTATFTLTIDGTQVPGLQANSAGNVNRMIFSAGNSGQGFYFIDAVPEPASLALLGLGGLAALRRRR